jgi:membrane-associated protein
MLGLLDTIIAFGYIGVFITIFAESGFLLGFFLPGDSLLFTVGLLSSQGYFNIEIIVILALSGAILGDNFGYWVGKKFGPKIFNRDDSFFFKKKYVARAAEFYSLYGKKAIILARFVPIVRTFVPIMAGVARMQYGIFVSYNVIGGIIWTVGVTLVAYTLGTQFPGIKEYLHIIIVGIILVSVLPIVFDLARQRLSKRERIQ